MPIENGKLSGIPFTAARWTGGPITPEIVILHDTASRLETGNAARYLADNPAKVSVHFVVERNGNVVQQVPVNRRANHAGKSHYHGRDNCNGFSIGIEIVNPGKMTRVSGAMNARAWFGQLFDIPEHGIEEIETREHGRGLWMAYTEAQIEAVTELLRTLFDGIPTLRDITTHWYVSPGRKVDTNPLFPLEQVRSLIFGREDPIEDDLATITEPAGADDFVQVNTPGDTLNLRRWPSFNPNVIATIPHGTILPVQRSGRFSGRDWYCVLYGGREGWIAGDYADPVTFERVLN